MELEQGPNILRGYRYILYSSILEKDCISLTSSNWLESELHACVRDEDYCRFTENSSLIIRPHSNFLAKNGLRRRLEPKEINILKTPEGNISNICPVTALITYLKHTSEFKVGCLFLNPKNNKSLSLPQLRQHICSLITSADPNTRAKVHDIRKFAASCSLQQDMLVRRHDHVLFSLIRSFNNVMSYTTCR